VSGFSPFFLQDRLRLLCPAGGCAPVDQPDACNLGKVSAHAVVGTADFKASPAGAAAVRQLVTAARPNSAFLTAAKAVNSSTLLFQDTTVELQVSDTSSVQLNQPRKCGLITLAADLICSSQLLQALHCHTVQFTLLDMGI
jgi:hypothetical protein